MRSKACNKESGYRGKMPEFWTMLPLAQLKLQACWEVFNLSLLGGCSRLEANATLLRNMLYRTVLLYNPNLGAEQSPALTIPFNSPPIGNVQHQLFPTNIFDMLAAHHDDILYHDLFEQLDTSLLEANCSRLGQRAYHFKLIVILYCTTATVAAFSGHVRLNVAAMKTCRSCSLSK